MTLLQLFALAIGTAIGVGWITALHLWVGAAGSIGASLAFVVGALICTPIARCYGQLGAEMPGTGGEMLYGRVVFGPAGETLTGAWLLLAFVVTCSFEAVSVGWLLTEILPGSAGPRIYTAFGRDVTLGAIIFILLFTAIIFLVQKWGTLSVARMQTTLTLAMLLIVFFLAAAGFSRGEARNLQPLVVGAGAGAWFKGFVAVLITTPFWFAGFNVAAQAADSLNARHGARRLKAVMTAVVWGAAIFYCAIILSATALTSSSEFADAPLPAAAVFEAAFGSRIWSDAVLVAGLLGLLTTWNAVFFAGVRVAVALAERGAILAPSNGGSLPTWSIVAVAITSTALALLGRGALGAIVNVVGFIFAWMFLITCTACLRPRLIAPAKADSLSRRTAATGVVVSLGIIVLWCFDVISRTRADAWPLELIVVAGWMLVSAGLLALGRGARARSCEVSHD